MVFPNFQFAIAGWITDKNTKANTQIGLLSEAVCDSSSLLQFVAGVPFYQDSVLYAFKMYQCHIVTNRTTIHLEFHERSLECTNLCKLCKICEMCKMCKVNVVEALFIKNGITDA